MTTRNITPNQAHRLAIAYAAYLQAVREDDIRGMRVWCRDLKALQEITGAYPADPGHLVRLIELCDGKESTEGETV